MGLSSIYGAGAGAALSLLAGNANVPYQGQVTNALNQAQGYGTAVGNAAGNLTTTGNQALSGYQSFQPQEAGQEQQYLSLLNANPYTDSYSASQLANATAGTNAAYQGGTSNLESQLAARGLAGDGGSGASSALAGGLTYMNLAKAGTLGNAQNQIAQNAIQQRYSNLANAANSSRDYASTLYGRGTGALQAGISGYGAGAGIDSSVANGYLSLSGAQQAANTQQANEFQGIGSGIGTLAGMGAGDSSGGSQPWLSYGPVGGGGSLPNYLTGYSPNGAVPLGGPNQTTPGSNAQGYGSWGI